MIYLATFDGWAHLIFPLTQSLYCIGKGHQLQASAGIKTWDRIKFDLFIRNRFFIKFYFWFKNWTGFMLYFSFLGLGQICLKRVAKDANKCEIEYALTRSLNVGMTFVTG